MKMISSKRMALVSYEMKRSKGGREPYVRLHLVGVEESVDGGTGVELGLGVGFCDA